MACSRHKLCPTGATEGPQARHCDACISLSKIPPTVVTVEGLNIAIARLSSSTVANSVCSVGYARVAAMRQLGSISQCPAPHHGPDP